MIFGANFLMLAMSANCDIIFDVLVETLDDALILVDQENIVRRFNESAGTILGARILNTPLANFLRHPELTDVFAATRASGRASGHASGHASGVGGGTLRYQHIATQRRDYQIRVFLLLDDMLLIMLHDISHALDVEKTQADFVANVSHELRSPLTALVGFIETLGSLLSQGGAHDQQKARQFLEIMAAEAARMQRLLDSLLNITRQQAAVHQPLPDLFDIDALLVDICKLRTQAAQKMQMSLDIIRMFEPPLMVRADGDGLREVFDNLLDNAFKYGTRGHAVIMRVSAVQDKDELIIEVINQGAPIAAHHILRLTERFYRIDAARTGGGTQPASSGLGLAIVQQILRRHGGHITITSTAEGTNNFAVHLPRAT